jgi:hypothetical protein
MSVAKRASEDRARFGSHRTRGAGSFALALDDLAALGGGGVQGMIRMRPTARQPQALIKDAATAVTKSIYQNVTHDIDLQA